MRPVPLALRRGPLAHKSLRDSRDLCPRRAARWRRKADLAGRPAHILRGCSGSTPRFPKTPWEIVKIHDFPSNLIDFHGKSMKNHGFSWPKCLGKSGCRSRPPPQDMCRPSGRVHNRPARVLVVLRAPAMIIELVRAHLLGAGSPAVKPNRRPQR